MGYPRRKKYILNTRSLHGYPCKSSRVNPLYTCYQWLKNVRVNGSPASWPTKVGFYGCWAQHITNLMWGRWPSLEVWVPSGLCITYMKGRSRFTKGAQGTHHYNMQWLEYKFLGPVSQRYGWDPQQFSTYCPGKLEHVIQSAKTCHYIHIYIATMHGRLHMQLLLTTKNYPPFSCREVAVYISHGLPQL
jgi:hypothetical protein